MRANPLLRVKVKFAVKNAVCNGLGHLYTAVLTVILTLALKSAWGCFETRTNVALNEFNARLHLFTVGRGNLQRILVNVESEREASVIR